MVARYLLAVTLIVIGAVTLSVTASPYDRNFQSSSDYEDPEYVLAMLNRLLHSRGMESLIHPNAKRGLDLGLGRGFSGSQAAKHLMGLSAANFAGGPGRRKRDVAGEEVEVMAPKALPMHQAAEQLRR